MSNEKINANPYRNPKRSITADGFKYLFRHTQEFIDQYPLHSSDGVRHLTPLQYHGYNETEENILQVMEELQYEMKVYPEHSDILLDKYNEMDSLLKIITHG